MGIDGEKTNSSVARWKCANTAPGVIRLGGRALIRLPDDELEQLVQTAAQIDECRLPVARGDQLRGGKAVVLEVPLNAVRKTDPVGMGTGFVGAA